MTSKDKEKTEKEVNREKLILKLLGEEDKVKFADYILKQKRISILQMSKDLNIPQSTLCVWVKYLWGAGLLKSEKKGKYKFHNLV